jgi:hypothetical protein
VTIIARLRMKPLYPFRDVPILQPNPTPCPFRDVPILPTNPTTTIALQEVVVVTVDEEMITGDVRVPLLLGTKERIGSVPVHPPLNVEEVGMVIVKLDPIPQMTLVIVAVISLGILHVLVRPHRSALV